MVLLIRGKDGQGEEVIKPYTPTTLDSDVGYFELVIKVEVRLCLFVILRFSCASDTGLHGFSFI